MACTKGGRMTLRISSLTKEYVKTKVTAKEAGVEVDPTGDVVEFAFTARDADPTTWTAGAWETIDDDDYWARVVIGPGGDITLPKGEYDAWVRITEVLEIPARRFDVLIVF